MFESLFFPDFIRRFLYICVLPTDKNTFGTTFELGKVLNRKGNQ